MIENLFEILLDQNAELTRRLRILTSPTLRDRIIRYLSSAKDRSGDDPSERLLSRDELAEYLQVNRSALSRELGRMREEGLVVIAGRRILLNGRP